MQIAGESSEEGVISPKVRIEHAATIETSEEEVQTEEEVSATVNAAENSDQHDEVATDGKVEMDLCDLDEDDLRTHLAEMIKNLKRKRHLWDKFNGLTSC